MRSRPNLVLSLAFLVFITAACRKTDPVAGLEKSAAELENIPAAPADAGQAAAGPAPAEQVRKAIADFKSGNMTDAVTRLQLLRAQTVMTPEQRMSLQDSIATVMQEIYSLAEQGDPRAKAAVAQYESLQTGR